MRNQDLLERNRSSDPQDSYFKMTGVSVKNIYYLSVLQATVLVCGTLLCFVVAYARGDVSLYLPFVSETGAYSPEKCLFSLSLIIGSFLGFIIYFHYYAIMKQNNQNERSFSILNMSSLVIGGISMLGLAGVAAFPMTTVFWAHLLFASMYFVGSTVYFITVSILTYKSEGATRKCILRSALSFAISIFLVLISILFPLSLARWRANNKSIPALKTPENKGFTLLLLSSVLEWSIVIVIVIYNLSLIMDLKKYSFRLIVAEKPSKITIVTEAPPVPQG